MSYRGMLPSYDFNYSPKRRGSRFAIGQADDLQLATDEYEEEDTGLQRHEIMPECGTQRAAVRDGD